MLSSKSYGRGCQVCSNGFDPLVYDGGDGIGDGGDGGGAGGDGGDGGVGGVGVGGGHLDKDQVSLVCIPCHFYQLWHSSMDLVGGSQVDVYPTQAGGKM